MKKTRVVIALGGNALQKNGEVSAEAQKAVAEQIGNLIAELSDRFEILVTHGNGPQVGNIMLHEESASTATAPAMPLETAVAMSQGQIGYWLAQAIDNAFSARGQNKIATSIVTQVIVDPADPAFSQPSKPIGEFYDETTASRLAKERHWAMQEDAGRGYRRVVPSPQPVDIVESSAILTLLEADTVVVAAGGGGVPVVRQNGALQGIDAVIDKDLTSAKLAKLVHADIFVSVTAVPNVYTNFGQPNQKALDSISESELPQYIASGEFASGSMLPKIHAIMDFVEGDRIGIIASPENLSDALELRSGTIVRAN